MRVFGIELFQPILYTDRVKMKARFPRRHSLTTFECTRLKNAIKTRLGSEDYTCRLPKIKPRVRYKLTARWSWVPYGKFVHRYEQVWK